MSKGLVSRIKNKHSGKKYFISTAQEIGKDYWNTAIFPTCFFGLLPNFFKPLFTWTRNTKEEAYEIHWVIEDIVEKEPEDKWIEVAPSPIPPDGYSEDAIRTFKEKLGFVPKHVELLKKFGEKSYINFENSKELEDFMEYSRLKKWIEERNITNTKVNKDEFSQNFQNNDKNNSIIKCVSCGAGNKFGNNFCTNCGTKLIQNEIEGIKKSIEENEKELLTSKNQKQKIIESKKRNIFSNLAEYEFPTGLKIYYPSYFEILVDDLDEENDLNEGKEDYSLLKTVFYAFKSDPSMVSFKSEINPEIIKLPDFFIEVLRNGYEEFGFRWMMRREDMFVELLRYKGYIINEDEINKEYLIKMYIKQAIDNFTNISRNPKKTHIEKYSEISRRKFIEIKKVEKNYLIWIEKLKFENYNQLFIRTGKYLLYYKEDNFYAFTINILATPKIYLENIDLINTIIEKSGFDDSRGVLLTENNNLTDLEISNIKCLNCNYKNNQTNNYCTNCGAKLTKNELS
jgi:hypothetical protein